MTTTFPIACTLSPDELRARRDELFPGLAAQAIAIERIENGVRLQFSPTPEIVTTIARVVDAERQCCRFLKFDLSIQPHLGPIALTITGPAEAQELLAEL